MIALGGGEEPGMNGAEPENDPEPAAKAEEKDVLNPAYEGSNSTEDCPMGEEEEEDDKTLERKLCEEMHNSEFKADMDLVEAMEEEESMKEAAVGDTGVPSEPLAI
jgi:hypothetical protein